MAQPASCYNCNNARAARTDGSASELCVDNYLKNNIYLTTTCERFTSLAKHIVLDGDPEPGLGNGVDIG